MVQFFFKERTSYSTDIFNEHFDRVEKVIAKCKIITDNQFYDINSKVDYISYFELVDEQKIDVLNSLLLAYEQRKSRFK